MAVQKENTEMGLSHRFKIWAKALNLKTLIKGITLVLGIGLVILCSVITVGLDFSKIDWQSWLGKTILLLGIQVFGLLMGESIGRDKQMERIGGLYQVKVSEFDLAHRRIQDIQENLDDYLIKLQGEEQEREEIKLLKSVGIRHAEIIREMKASELKELHSSALNYKGVDLRQLNDEQFEMATDVINGCVKIPNIDSSYLLNKSNEIIAGGKLSRGKHIDKKIGTNKWVSRFSKIVSSLIISACWSAFTIQDFMDAGSGEAWLNLFSRVFALISSFCAGYSSAIIEVKLRANKLDFKIEILTDFYNAYFIAKTFKPTDMDEIAHEEVIAAETKKAKEKVEVEIVDMNKDKPLGIEEKPVINI